MPEALHAPSAFQRVFEGLEPPLVVGGQAVNLWALTFLRESPELKNFEPFTSRDCDLYGGEALLAQLSKLTGWTAIKSRRRSPSPVLGHLRGTASDGSDLLVEVLFTVRGLTDKEIKQNEVRLEVDGRIYRTLSPISLLKAKLANLVELQQAERYDLRHVQILTICVAGYVMRAHAKLESGEMDDKAFLKLLKECQRVVCSEQAHNVAATKQVSFRGCFPDVLRESPSERVRNFFIYQIKSVP